MWLWLASWNRCQFSITSFHLGMGVRSWWKQWPQRLVTSYVRTMCAADVASWNPNLWWSIILVCKHLITEITYIAKKRGFSKEMRIQFLHQCKRIYCTVISCFDFSLCKNPNIWLYVGFLPPPQVPYSGKLSREKTFTNFAVLRLFATKFGGVGFLAQQNRAIRKNCVFYQFAKVFSLWNFA